MHNSTRDALLYEPLLLCGPTNDTKIRVQKKKRRRLKCEESIFTKTLNTRHRTQREKKKKKILSSKTFAFFLLLLFRYSSFFTLFSLFFVCVRVFEERERERERERICSYSYQTT